MLALTMRLSLAQHANLYKRPLCALLCRFASTATNLSVVQKEFQIQDLDGVAPPPEASEPVNWRLPHVTYTKEELEGQESGHHRPRGFVEWSAYQAVRGLRGTYDVVTGYTWGRHHEKALLTRVMFLETVAGVPGIVGAFNRHLRSLRRCEQDYGWIHTLLEEAENERMHLMTAILLKRPHLLLRLTITLSQGLFTLWYATMYALSPRFCHRFVGYLEEEAFVTYSLIVRKIDEGKLPGFLAAAPIGARRYWNMPDDATLRDIFLAMRADENHHRIVNHAFADMDAKDPNPFPPGY